MNGRELAWPFATARPYGSCSTWLVPGTIGGRVLGDQTGEDGVVAR